MCALGFLALGAVGLVLFVYFLFQLPPLKDLPLLVMQLFAVLQFLDTALVFCISISRIFTIL